MNNLTLTSFSKPGVPIDARLHIEKEDTTKAYVAPEKFSSKVLTWLGKVPVFKDLDAVQKHVEHTKVQNQKTLQAFLVALREKYADKSVDSVVLMAGLNNSTKPLTQRLAKQLELSVQSTDAHFSKLIADKENAGLKNVSLVVKGAERETVEHVSDFGAEMKQQMLDITLKGLMRAMPQLEKIEGNSLRENFEAMASGNGVLRSLMTNLQGVMLIPEAKPLHDYVTTLKNIQIGPAPFSQWGTPNGTVGAWIDHASDQEVTQAVNKMHAITKELQLVTTELQKMKIGAPTLKMLSGPTLDLARFSVISIPIHQHTQVKLNDGTPLPVNALSFSGKAVALAGSYPKSTSAALEAHMKMLFEKQCSCLMVLTPEDQMQAGKLPAYFRGNHTFGEVHSSSQQVKSANLGIDQYHMQLTRGEKQHSLPVLHVRDWPDDQSLQAVAQLEYLADSVKSMANQNGVSGLGSSEMHLPMIHCLGGVGRTGTMAAALVLKDNPHSDLEQIRSEFRGSRNKLMMEDSSQFLQLKAMQNRLLTNTIN